MNPHRHSPRRFPLGLAGVMLLVTFAATPLFARGIRVMITPFNSQANAGEQITVAIHLDVSASAEFLGSCTGSFQWNPQVLKLIGYVGGATTGFSNPVLNKEKAAQGRLTFAHAYPEGGKGKVSLLNLTFEVIGATGSRSDFAVEFSAMASAYTFKDLLPQVEKFTTGVKEAIAIVELPKAYALLQNRPNPFNPETEIGYELPEESLVVLAIFNLLGQRIKTLVNGSAQPGKHTARWDGTDEAGKIVPSGIYIYRIEAEGFIQEKKMMLLR